MSREINGIPLPSGTCATCKFAYRHSNANAVCKVNPPMILATQAGPQGELQIAWGWPEIEPDNSCQFHKNKLFSANANSDLVGTSQ